MGLAKRGSDWPTTDSARPESAAVRLQKNTPLSPVVVPLPFCLPVFCAWRSIVFDRASGKRPFFGCAGPLQCHDVCHLMPHPNRSLSSPGLRNHPKQALDGLPSTREPSMPPSTSPPHRNSARRLCPRRPRPSVASIADIFVGSLVLASFCNEHSPSRRGISTASWSPSDRNLHRFRTQGAPGRRQPSRQPPEYSRPSLNPSQPQRWISHGLARTKDEETEESSTHSHSQREAEADDDYIPLSPAPSAGTETQKQPQRFNFTYTHDIDHRIHRSNHTALDFDTADLPRQSFPSWRHPEKDKRISTAKLYQRTLTGYNWQEAVTAVAPRPRFFKAKEATSHDQTEIDSVAELVRTLWGESNPSTQYLFRLYRELPSPGMAYLSQRTRGALLRMFAQPRDRRWVDARRYLALVDDMVAARLPLSLSLWSSAIHLAGRGNGKVMRRDLIRAVGMWQRMEHVAGVKADEVVFNILFDVAIKAGAFQVAERLEEEMTGRGMGFSRCGKVSKIYYFGLMRDADGIRHAFNEFIDSGELVDTVVMNCLIASFLRAGETQTAEQLYARMLEQHQTRSTELTLSNRTESAVDAPNLGFDMPQYRQRARNLGRVLKKSAALKEKFPEYHRVLQSSLPMRPDTRTFHILLRHYAINSGHLDSFMAVMRDMEKVFSVPPRAIIYLFLFEGFSLHGRRKKQWSAENLRLTWHAYIRALRDSHARLRGLYLNNHKMTWENPLAKSVATEIVDDGVEVTDAPNGLYMSLPSADAEVKAEQNMDESTKNAGDAPASPDDESISAQLGDAYEASSIDELDPEEVFAPPPEFPEAEETPWDPEKRIENGVFVGRRMIINILQAFGTCCGPKEVLEVWLQLERLWHPNQRTANDVLIVKEELDRQMSRGPHHYR
ncbi:unnamed protein product [Penicillium olsonii]|uniref:Pentatricopeptide repeat protein n=1 Tax=Penicillium olsonii TaxID=99116 RepID=A0A9W4HEE3_PENOL|nr:unnamed protein product [Penicillium olsonii]